MSKNAETGLYHELADLNKRKDEWRERIPYVCSLLDNQSTKIKAKALWMLGEMGLLYPDEVGPRVERIAPFLHSAEALLRERGLNALGRIGRARFPLVQQAPEMLRVMGKRRPQAVQPYLPTLRLLADTDPHPVVRIHAAGAIRATKLQ